MKQVTISIPDNKYSFFMELISSLGLKVQEESVETTQEDLEGLEQSFKEVKQIQDGERKGTPLKEFLDEL